MMLAVCLSYMAFIALRYVPSILTLLKVFCNVFFFLYKFIYFWLRWVFVAGRGLFSSCGERGLLFVAVHGLLIAVASLVVEHGL